jgi:hypothetical protein
VWGALILVSTTEELLDRKVAAPVYKTENTAVGIRHPDHVAPSIRKKLAITSPTSGGYSVGIVRSWTQTTEFLVYTFNETGAIAESVKRLATDWATKGLEFLSW